MSRKSAKSLRRLAVAKVEQPAKPPRPTLDRASDPAVVARQHRRSGELTAQPLVKAFSVTMRAKLAKQISEAAFPADHELVEAFGPYRLHESLRVRAVCTPATAWGTFLELRSL